MVIQAKHGVIQRDQLKRTCQTICSAGTRNVVLVCNQRPLQSTHLASVRVTLEIY